MTGRVTKRVVDSIAPGVLLWDTDVRGFAVRRRAGEGAVYVVKYRLAGGAAGGSAGIASGRTARLGRRRPRARRPGRSWPPSRAARIQPERGSARAWP